MTPQTELKRLEYRCEWIFTLFLVVNPMFQCQSDMRKNRQKYSQKATEYFTKTKSTFNVLTKV